MDRKKYDDILKEMRDISIRKNADYSDEPIIEFGRYGLLVRSWDKICRIKNLMKKKDAFVKEKIRDTALDLCNYMIYLVMIEDEELQE